MAPALTRVKKEQLRKRRNNLLRRHNEFWLLYGIKSWLVMELPDGQIVTYHSHPNSTPPSAEDMRNRSKPPIVKTSHDYETTNLGQPTHSMARCFDKPTRESGIWEDLAHYLDEYRRLIA
ncbi:hypothetical protein N7509_000144 [Penicillium cosmopolitanum]|uniref:MADS-box domain-containing protein n=1 Tax=Penicillium cosmopolitanum TaxID=1131564 RepID=A0A9W9WCU3_9EURO|nr:uncharacterized protein N7509_008224 [Penicillium cosmopolitanum]XP_056494693.1 uncharacterized protein N7509_000181 [Penicillium cosmopolitanum]XP_056494892.1 uncharacterized protein N7509_000144 [Penicillium cosmopolitanum]KAJ5385683.1 hypothetical protein N7509_008224 [Penicillium cosmopolitanum]KAJ5414847.1 hypothetical protein N7509_000181 [Penicillium cosmopolitanum]KAJ5415046.1 hypothetical protein N7509_000144 [Penicillium cosmopolitanum]